MNRPLRIVNGRTVDTFGRHFEPDLAAIERKRRYNEKHSRRRSSSSALSTPQAVSVMRCTG